MKTAPAPIILTTDFGYQDEYVGVLKAVILSVNSTIPIVDLCHAVAPQDVARAADLITNNFHYFPKGSIHLCIVDPGVGSGRRILAMRAAEQMFVGPDNGIFSRLIQGQVVEIFEVTNRSWFLDHLSTTFQGRDVMAPVAARLAIGEPIDTVGRRVQKESCVLIPSSSPVFQENGLTGKVVSIDRFGNIRTNIKTSDLDKIAFSGKARVVLKDTEINIIPGSYSDIAGDRPAALINGSNELEICVKNSSAARFLDVEIGAEVVVHG